MTSLARARYVPDRMSPSSDSRLLAVRRAKVPQASVSAGRPLIVAETSQADGARAATRAATPMHRTMIGELHRHPGLALRPAGTAAGLLPHRLWRRLAQPVLRRRLAGVLAVLAHPGGQVSDLRPELLQLLAQPRDLRIPRRDLHPQLRDLRVPFRQQLPQPGVRRAQPGSITGHRGRIGHKPQFTTAGPRHAEPAGRKLR